MTPWAKRFRVGDTVQVDPLWNRTTRDKQIPISAQVLQLQRARSQEGLLVSVRSFRGEILDLDAGWFIRIDRENSNQTLTRPRRVCQPTQQAKLF